MPNKPEKGKPDNRIMVRTSEEMLGLIHGFDRKTHIGKASLVRAAMREFFANHKDVESQMLACGRNGGIG